MLKFSSICSTSLIGKLLRKSLNIIVPKRTVIPILQGPAKGMKWIVGSSVHGCWLGSYESEKQKKILEYLKPGMVAYDIGANVGFYTLMFSKIVGPYGKVYTFEPLSKNIEFLQKHLELNNLINVIIEPIAVSDQDKEITFYQHQSPSMGTIIIDHIECINTNKVLSISLDNYIIMNKNPSPDFVKIDVEGAESLVLTGMKRLMRTKKPVLFIAFHGEEIAKQCSVILTKFNYTTLNLEGRLVDIGHTYSDEIIAI